MRLRLVREMPAGALSPSRRQILDEVGYRLAVLFCRSAIPALCITGPLGTQSPPRDPDVPAQRLKHMLPGTNRARAANLDRAAARQRADHIGNEPVGGPVTTANDVSGSGAGDSAKLGASIPAQEKRSTVGARHKFGAPF